MSCIPTCSAAFAANGASASADVAVRTWRRVTSVFISISCAPPGFSSPRKPPECPERHARRHSQHKITSRMYSSRWALGEAQATRNGGGCATHWHCGPIWLRPDVQIAPRPEPAVLISVLSALRRRSGLAHALTVPAGAERRRRGARLRVPGALPSWLLLRAPRSRRVFGRPQARGGTE